MDRHRALVAAALAAASFGVYAAARSPDPTAVDGGLRSILVYHKPYLHFHENNHMLYPVDVLAWGRLVGAAAGPAAGPLEYFRRTELMNGLATAVAVGTLFLLVAAGSGSTRAGLAAACGFGLARGVLLHATNAAEPSVGLMYSLLAVGAAAASRGGRAWPAALSGVLTAAAMATYQTMVLAGPAALLLCAAGPTEPDPAAPARRVRWGRVAAYFGGAVAGVASIYGWAYARQGIVNPADQLRRFLTVDGGTQVYGGLSVSKFVNTPIGLVGNVFYAYPSDYGGLRALIRDHRGDAWPAWLAAVVLASAGVALILTLGLWRSRRESQSRQRLALAAAGLGFACSVLAPLYWTPTYDKLWLQPAAALSALVALAAASLPAGVWRRAAVAAALTLLAVEAGSNLVWLVPNARRETPYLAEARRVNDRIGPGALLVYEWDGVSLLCSTVLRHGQPDIGLTTEVYAHGPAAIETLRARIKDAERRGSPVYFLGVLDQTEESWNSFHGTKLGVPFSVLDEFRARCRPVMQFQFGNQTVTLHEYQPRPAAG